MDEEKLNIEFEEQEIEKNEGRLLSFRDFLSGNLLLHRSLVKQIPFILFLVFLGLVYISNRYHAESLYRQIDILEKQCSELRSKQLNTTTKLMRISKPSEVTRLVNKKGLELEELVDPPKVLVKNQKKN